MRLPEKYENEMKDLLQEEYEAYKESLGLPIQQGYRINTGKISKEEWEKNRSFFCERGSMDRKWILSFR